MGISTEICLKVGHKIVSLPVNDAVIPLPSNPAPVVAAKYLTVCSCCGLGLDAIVEMDKRPKPRERKPKAAKPVQENS